MVDLHIHTRNSSDSEATPREIAEAALDRGLSMIALTDHADFGYKYTLEQLIRVAQGSMRDACEIESITQGALTVLRGIEVGGVPYDPEAAPELIGSAAFDVVLGSVHEVKGKGFFMDSYVCDFSEMPMERIDDFMHVYFDVMYKLVSTADIDVLTHLTYPLRYINGKYGRGVDEMRYREQITAVLEKIIERGIALEVNTASVDRLIYDFVPSEGILALYRSLGGTRVTLGSDAHVGARVAIGFDDARRMLLSLGFSHYYYFKQRRPIAVPL